MYTYPGLTVLIFVIRNSIIILVKIDSMNTKLDLTALLIRIEIQDRTIVITVELV